jgi:glycosyltransferase involved in cell wall biosynthesis
VTSPTTNTDPLISVIIPTYNRAHCIDEAIQSVLAQTAQNWELLVIDDGSTDKTAEVLAKYGDKIRAIKQANSGPSAARNLGARSARGKFLAFLDSDDKWLPDKLAEQINLMSHEGVIFSATNWQGKDDTLGITAFDSMPFTDPWICTEPADFVSRIGGHNVMLSSWLVKRDILLSLGGFDCSADPAEDNHLLFRLSFKGHFALTKKVLLLRETGVDDVKLSRPGADLKYHRKVVRSMCLAAGNARMLAFRHPKKIQRQFSRLFAYYLRREMEIAAMDGNYWAARRRALEVLINQPSAKDAFVACLGIVFPFYIRRREHQKYVQPGSN